MSEVLWNPDLKVRLMRAEELDAVRAIGTRAFRMNFLDSYAGEEVLVGETPDGRLVCCLSLPEQRPLWWGRGQVPAATVGNVATLPTAHGKGHGGALMVHTVRHMRELGVAVCPLWPFSLAFYRKFGWEQTTGDFIVRAWPEMLNRLPGVDGEVRPATLADIPALNRLHATLAMGHNATSVRDDAWWTGPYAKNDFPERCLVHVGKDGGGGEAIDGWTIYRTSPNMQSQGSTVRAVETWGAAPQVLAALARGLGRLPGAVSVHIIQAADSLLPDCFPDRVPVDRAWRFELRVVNVARALECLRPPESLSATLAFEVTDWIIDGDKPQGYVARIEGGRVTVERAAHNDALRCPVNVFARLYSGGLRAAQARALGLLAGGSPAMDAACDALLYGRQPFRSELETG